MAKVLNSWRKWSVNWKTKGSATEEKKHCSN